MKYQIPSNLDDKGRTVLCTSQHPNHKAVCQIYGKPHFWTAWCSRCEMSGLPWRPNYGYPVPDMDASYRAEIEAWARAAFQEQRRKSAERKARRGGASTPTATPPKAE